MSAVPAPTPQPGAQPQIVWRDLDSIQPSPENALLYKNAPNSPDIEAMALQMRREGFRESEPIEVTTDSFIVSGHRRFLAASMAWLDEVPVIVGDVCRAACTKDEYIAILASRNEHQRVKTLDEVLREQIVTADPNVAYANVIEHRKQKRARSFSLR